MHVLYLHQHFSIPTGSGGLRSYEFARALTAAGHTVTMVCGSSDKADAGLSGPFTRGVRSGIVDDINVIEFDLGYSNHAGLWRRAMLFAKFAARSTRVALGDADVVFATSTPLTAAIPALLAKARHRRRPFVFEVRDLWPELPQAMGVVTNPIALAALRALEVASYRAADALIGLSPGICEGIERTIRNRIGVQLIPNGCDLELFERHIAPEAGESPTRFVFAGAHGIANGLDAVLDAAACLRDRSVDSIEIHLIGDGSQKQRLIDRARSEGLANVVFRDMMPKVELARILHEFDAGLMVLANVEAFYRGTSPNKFFDYLAAGLPVLNNYPGWVSDMISDHGCGIAIDADDPAAFADAIQTFASLPRDERVAMGDQAHRLGSADFNRSDLARKFVAVLEQAAAS